MNKPLRILLTGGGSGGHVYPLLAVADELQKLAAEEKIVLELKYIGPEDEYAELLKNSGIEVQNILAGKLRRYFSIENLLDVPKFAIGFIEALFKIFWIMPDVIFSKGGTGALPVTLAGWFYRIPIIIHESDAVPGLTNLWSGKFAARIAVSFERAMNYFNPKITAWIGTPMRREMLADRPNSESAKEEFGFSPKDPLLLILGGSQGSERINDFIISNLEGLLKETQVLHQTGRANFRETEKLSRAALMNVPAKIEAKSRYRAVPYLEAEIKAALVAANLVLSRAGSGTISELSAFSKPAILIPLRESAGDHQRINAYEFAKSGAAVVIEEANLLPGIFLNQVRSILKDKTLLNKMSLASGKFFKPGAAEVIAREILRLTE